VRIASALPRPLFQGIDAIDPEHPWTRLGVAFLAGYGLGRIGDHTTTRALVRQIVMIALTSVVREALQSRAMPAPT